MVQCLGSGRLRWTRRRLAALARHPSRWLRERVSADIMEPPPSKAVECITARQGYASPFGP